MGEQIYFDLTRYSFFKGFIFNIEVIDESSAFHDVVRSFFLQKSLTEQPDDSNLDLTLVEENKSEESTIPGLEIIIDDDDDDDHPSPTPSETAEIVSLESDESKAVGVDQDESQELPIDDDGDDDDVILNEVAPIKIVLDDDDEEYNPEEPIENLVKIKKEKVDKVDDGFVEVSGLVSLQNGGQIKIKAEPIDAGKHCVWLIFLKIVQPH